MAKKINPKEQTAELNRARLEFLKRNAEKLQELRKVFSRNEKKRDIFTTHLASYSGNNQKIKEAWDFLLQECLFDKDYKEILTEIETLPAANTGWHFMRFVMDHGYQAMAHGGEDVFFLTKDALNAKFLDYLCRNAREIFSELTNGQPSKYLLVGIDLSRTKEVIRDEVAELVKQHQDKTGLGLEDIPQKRFKWLPIVDDLLEVWDLYDQAGQQPWQKTFPRISRKVKRPLSTVKSQWYQAYEKINGKPYDPKSKYTTEEKRRDADQLCSECPHGAVCYKKSGEWIPCQEYFKIAGREKSLKTIEYMDNIRYSADGRKNRKKTSDKQ
ncbi:MAG: hypothetical protein V2A69_05220 [Pseudomonadota bacterium]